MENEVSVQKKKRVSLDNFIYYREKKIQLEYHAAGITLASLICLSYAVVFFLLQGFLLIFGQGWSRDCCTVIIASVVSYFLFYNEIVKNAKVLDEHKQTKPDRYDEYELSFRRIPTKKINRNN